MKKGDLTENFIKKVKELIEDKTFRNRREVVRFLQWQESALSSVMAGKRPVPEEKAYKLLELNNSVKSSKANAVPLDMTDKRIMWVPLVNRHAQAGYLTGYGDAEYVESLPALPFPADKEYRGTYMAFEVRGDSMFNDSYNSLKEGDIVLCRELSRDLWRNKLHFKRWDKFVIVTRTDGILIKEITDHDVAKGIITAHSWNDIYPDLILKLDDVAQLFNVVQTLKSG